MKIGTPHELAIPSSAVRDFYASHWNRRIPLSDDRFYRWQFLTPPGTDSRDNCCIAVDKDQGIIGVMGLHERPFAFGGSVIAGAELTTWIVRQDTQKRGVGPQMLQFLQAKYEFLLGLGITPPAVSIYLRHGFRFFNPIPRYMRVLNWEHVEPFAQIDERAGKIDRYWKQERTKVPYQLCDVDPVLVDTIGDEFATSSNMFIRNFKFLKWRYFDHPTYEYKVAVVRAEDSATGAVVAFRVQDPTPSLRIAHVLDLYGDDSSMQAALSYLDDELTSAKVDFADFYSTSGRHQGLFLCNDWFSIGSDNFFNFPHLFNPVELRAPASTSMVVWTRSSRELIFNVSNSYFSKQDSDFDRP
jgi:hypothetical protein